MDDDDESLEGKPMGPGEEHKTKTPLQKLVTSLKWDAAMMVVILLNCLWIAIANPRIVSVSLSRHRQMLIS
jgi:hypothetical protein